MRINNNIMAYNAYRNVTSTNDMLAKSLEKLASGVRINRAADDAAGLVISEDLRTNISGLTRAVKNTSDGISVLQIAEGSLNEVHNMLRRMRDLAIQAANTGANDQVSRNAAQAEVVQLLAQADRIGAQTRFGGLTLFTTANFTFQVGQLASDQVIVTLQLVTTAGLTIATVNVGTGTQATASLITLDIAIDAISTLRGRLGAYQNRFEGTVRNLNIIIENTQAAESRIRDTDMAAETVTFTKLQILSQSGTAMLAQANTLPQSVLSLLRG